MLRKVTFSLMALLFVAAPAFAAIAGPVAPVAPEKQMVDPALLSAFTQDGQNFTTEDFLALTPKKIREATGRKLSLKESIGLKLAQKKVKKQIRRQNKGKDAPGSKGLFIILAIFVPIAAVIFMGVADDWEGNTWWIALILYALCYLPGLIYTLTKVKDYY
ncbi:MAG: YqaE/Pmp3 family membrane protein [Bacteroidota bacterium]